MPADCFLIFQWFHKKMNCLQKRNVPYLFLGSYDYSFRLDEWVSTAMLSYLKLFPFYKS
jgi:hypothetical protein